MRAPQTRVSDGHEVAGEPTCLMFDGPSPIQTESAYSLLPGNPHSRDAPLSLSNYYCSLIVALRYSPPLASCTARPKNNLFLGLPAPPNSCSQVIYVPGVFPTESRIRHYLADVKIAHATETNIPTGSIFVPSVMARILPSSFDAAVSLSRSGVRTSWVDLFIFASQFCNSR